MFPSNRPSSGSTGGVVRVALQTLLDKKLVPVSQLRISSYNTAGNPPSIRNTDNDIRKANLYEPATLNDSYSGAEVLFLVSFVEEEPGASRRTAMSSTPQGPSAYKTSFTHRFRSANAPRELPALRK
ncbi:hypothetical protein J3458_000034 [Metarhizium acridum]|uniref:uncharacterized protein n=1 Tax=Metarhizium acridum TaxID=92637 RepID=UPI001C6AD31B|nr:hypothetical protein J3458_000034 [Metarhizium acridum]